MKELRIIYFLSPLPTIILLVFLELLAGEGICLIELPAPALYVFRLFVALLCIASLVAPFTNAFRKKLLLQLLALDASAFLVILDYYLNISNPGSDNLLWFLPMILVVYVLRYKAVCKVDDSDPK